MSKKLKSLFKDKNLQAAADQILTDVDTPQARVALLEKFIAGEVNPTFEQSTAITAWLAKQKKTTDTGVEKSRTVTTSAVAPRRNQPGMTW